MKKQILLILLLMSLGGLAFGQATPGAQYRVATATTAFGINIPIGTTVYCVATDTYYLCKAATASTLTLTTGTANFTALAKGSHSHAQSDITNLTTDLASKVKYSDTVGGLIVGRQWGRNNFAEKTAIRYQYVEQWEEASAGSTGGSHSCSYTPLANTVSLELNGLPLTSTQYALSGATIQVKIPVYQYDRVKLSYSYIIGSGIPDNN